ncbi:MAG TPA: DNA polymerase III subunit delta' [Dehalococcoidia bacterium]|nr:DNA polymerase III subunit delta' [Dehalococcoidia bacterium]
MTSERRWADDWGMVGQAHAVSSLRHALQSGRLSHAYLLSGPEGIGKATLAIRLAQALNCDADAAPCLECAACRRVGSGAAPDVERITIGGVCDESSHDHSADNSTRIRICQVRRIERVANLSPFASPRRIFIVDTADELQAEGANALLKTLEEPPASSLLFLLATDPEALLPTIRSRCQQLALRPAPTDEVAAALVERADVGEADALDLARLSRGRYGRAVAMHSDPSLEVLRESATEQVRALSRASRNERLDAAEQLSRGWRQERESVLATLDIWRSWWRDVLLAVTAVDREGPASDVTEDCSPAEALRALSATQRAREHLLENTNAQLALEVLMLDLPVLPARDGEEAREDVAQPVG